MLRHHRGEQRLTGSDVPPVRRPLPVPPCPKRRSQGASDTTERMRSIAVNAVGRFLQPACSKPRFPVVSCPVVCCVFGVFHGPPRQLERLSAPFTGDLPG